MFDSAISCQNAFSENHIEIAFEFWKKIKPPIQHQPAICTTVLSITALGDGRQSNGEAASSLRVVGDVPGVSSCDLPDQR